MPYVYSSVLNLDRKKKVGSTQCVALVQIFAGLPHTGAWTPGAPVVGNHNIKSGTAIATFVNGRYLSRPSGNHAALFVRHDHEGFWVMDQWKDDRPLPENKKPYISMRFIKSKKLKQNHDGSWPQASNNADAYSVIETR